MGDWTNGWGEPLAFLACSLSLIHLSVVNINHFSEKWEIPSPRFRSGWKNIHSLSRWALEGCRTPSGFSALSLTPGHSLLCYLCKEGSSERSASAWRCLYSLLKALSREERDWLDLAAFSATVLPIFSQKMRFCEIGGTCLEWLFIFQGQSFTWSLATELDSMALAEKPHCVQWSVSLKCCCEGNFVENGAEQIPVC